uniref:Protein deacetylase HDAC6 n=1 Tax=Cyprinus carpio TaxID=7962 RepID=A0A8C2GWZ1_CYPCA
DAFTHFHCLWDARKEYVELMKSTQKMTEEELKTLAHKYDSVYLHPEFFASACLAVGSVLQLVDKVMTAQLRNGFSINRPPGHHAHADKMNGYCMFNNLAIAVRYAQKQHGVKRVLIVDWDVHHGQGIQYIFEEDPSVLYFSVHRYEDGSFWPHLKESDSSSVGSGAGQGYNINLPWNKTGMEDGDYVTAFQQLLLPVAYEFQPQLVLVAAGFDSVIGDPKGEMRVSPQCFSILTHMLKGVAQGRLVLALEGGYNLQSTAEGVCASVRSLLGDPCPHLTSPGAPSESALKSISETISALYPFWKSLQTFEGGPLSDVTPLPAPVCAEVKVSSPITGLVYDQRMMLHHNMWDGHHPELPQRISRIFCRHEELGLLSRCLRIPARLATEEELALCHSSAHISTIKSTEHMKPRDLHRLGNDYNSIYICNESYTCALVAAGSCFNSVRAIITGQVRNGVAIVRPPGHHAEKDTACGFCFFNTAALTARYAQSITHESLRVLILDWDVHHGNGTQHIFEEDDSVLYISLHRYEDGTFFPSSEDANYDKVGLGKGTGYNVNIPWNGGKMGDPEYMAAFHHIVMPIAREFAPELVLVSAGFDAARGDPLGGYQVTPEGYAHLTHQLMSLAAGRVLVILEGGYNLTSISESMSMCTSMLLGDSPPSLDNLPPPKTSATVTINNVLRAHAPFWSSLRIQSEFQYVLVTSNVFSHQTCSIEQERTIPESVVSGNSAAVDDQESSVLEAAGGHATMMSVLGNVFGAQDTMYVVDPLSWCPHLESVRPVPAGGIDVFLPCEECGGDTENWICLFCYKVLCGRYVKQHMVTHGQVSGHPMVLSFADLSVWCYACESYIHNKVLHEAKSAAHLVKFGEEIPPFS